MHQVSTGVWGGQVTSECYGIPVVVFILVEGAYVEGVECTGVSWVTC